MTSSSPVHIDTGDADIEELLSDQENEKIDTDGLCFDDLRHIFSAKKKWKSTSPAMGCVRVTAPLSVKKIQTRKKYR